MIRKDNSGILIVEDEGIIAEDLRFTLEDLGYKVMAVVASGEDAIKEVEEHKPELILMDLGLQGNIGGIEAARQISSCFNIPIIYITAYGNTKTIEEAKKTDPVGYIIKPFDDWELHAMVEKALG